MEARRAPGADDELGRAPADVDHDGRLDGGETPGHRAEERQLRLFVAAQHFRVERELAADPLGELPAVGCVPHGRGQHREVRLATVLVDRLPVLGEHAPGALDGLRVELAGRVDAVAQPGHLRAPSSSVTELSAGSTSAISSRVELLPMSTTATRTAEMLDVYARAAWPSADATTGEDSMAVAVALVTGANRGIGREVARQLAERRYKCCSRARDAEKAAAAAAEQAGDVRPLTLDVSDPASIAAARQTVGADPGRLDVLVNNAGVGSDFGVSGTDPDCDAIQRALDTNFYGAYRTAVAMLDLLRASPHPRIVNVSSGMGGVAEMGGSSPGYRVSKASMNAMTRILSTELREQGVLVNSACPGFVATDMGSPMGAQKPVEDGAAGIVWLATLPDDGPTGGFFRDGEPVAF